MGGFEQFIPILAIFALMYFLIIRPQNQERAAHEALIASLAKDDKVVTASGIYGTVVSVDNDDIVLEIADKTRILLEKKFVARRLEGEAAARLAARGK